MVKGELEFQNKLNNVVTEVRRRYAAYRKFLEVELESRVLAGTLTVLCIENLDDQPDESVLRDAGTGGAGGAAAPLAFC